MANIGLEVRLLCFYKWASLSSRNVQQEIMNKKAAFKLCWVCVGLGLTMWIMGNFLGILPLSIGFGTMLGLSEQ